MASVPAEAAALSGRTVLAVFAHPDDESIACGGTLARLSDAGVRVVLLCASRGERGSLSDPALVADGNLGHVRALELHDAARVLGISDVVLLDHRDGDLRWVNPGRLESDIVAAIEQYTPDLVITFDDDGLYWHLDHIGIHERTYDAVQSFGPAAPPLYYVTIPRGVMREVTNHAVAVGRVPEGSTFWGITPDAFGLLRKPHSLVVDVTPWVPRKLAAIQCHRTQMAVTNPITGLAPAEAERWLALEHFRREPVNTRPTLLETIGDPALSA